MNTDQIIKENKNLKNLVKFYEDDIEAHKILFEKYMDLLEKYKIILIEEEIIDIEVKKDKITNIKKKRPIPSGIHSYLKEHGGPATIEEIRQELVQKGIGKWKDENTGNRAVNMSTSRNKNFKLISDNKDIKLKKYALVECEDENENVNKES